MLEAFTAKLKDPKFWAGLFVALSAPMGAYQIGQMTGVQALSSAAWLLLTYVMGVRQESPASMAASGKSIQS